MRTNAVLIVALLVLSFAICANAQSPALLEKAHDAFVHARALDSALDEESPAERTRNEYLKVVKAYERVYLITPHTGYADDALFAIARLYEAIDDTTAAVRTLNFLVREYPATHFKDSAETDIARLQGEPALENATVDNVRYWEEQNSIRIVVDVGGKVHFTQGEAKSPDRVFIDISPARLSSSIAGKQWPVQSSLMSQIRVGQYDNTTVRVVLDVTSDVKVTTSMLQKPDRIVLAVIGDEPKVATLSRTASSRMPAAANGSSVPKTVTPAKTAALASKPAKSPADAAIPSPAVESPDAETRIITPAQPPNSGARSLVRSLGLKLSRVVIDPGHGGYDTGTIGPTGYTEKEFVLDVALRLKKLIETQLGAEVVLTRTDDRFVSLERRTAIANEQESDLFISIHANSSRVRSVRGVETYYLNFTSSREALETATRENAASDRSIHELQDLVNKIMLRDKVDESRELAQHIQRALMARKGAGTNRGVKQAPFVVLIGANMPSVLAEVSFISNPKEERLIKTEQHRQAIAESLFEGVKSYAETLSGLKTAKTQNKDQE